MNRQAFFVVLIGLLFRSFLHELNQHAAVEFSRIEFLNTALGQQDDLALRDAHRHELALDLVAAVLRQGLVVGRGSGGAIGRTSQADLEVVLLGHFSNLSQVDEVSSRQPDEPSRS